jgi:hypothetical protein
MCFRNPTFAYATVGKGAVAQLVEQWTENPCVAGSTPAHTTKAETLFPLLSFYIMPA